MEIINMKTNSIKDKEQRLALNAWANNKCIGSIIAGTGFGKSRLAVLAADYVDKKIERSVIIIKDNWKTANILILVPTVHLQKQFVEEFHKWGCSKCISNVKLLCYQSAYKLKGNHYDLVIADEIHLGLSREYRKFFENNTYDKLLCMTATLPEEDEYRMILSQLSPTIYNISLDKCVELELVSPYVINCIPVKLTVQEAIDYKDIHNKFLYYKYKLGQFNSFNEAKRIISDKNASGEEKTNAVQFYRTIRVRKTIVDFAANKINMFKDLVDKNLDKKILAFSNANDFTDSLANATDPNSAVYHSGKTKKQKELSIKSFKEGNTVVLCSTKALNQGLDVPNANMGIICGLTGKSLSMIQRVGRLLRYKKGKTGEIYVLYVKDSQEEKWLKNAVKNLDNIKWLTNL